MGRPKKEDWLKKKDRKQRRPGCRRKKTRKRGDCIHSHSDPLTDTSTTPDDIQTTPAAAKQLIGHEGQRTLLRPSGGFPPGPARFPPNLFQFKQQKILLLDLFHFRIKTSIPFK